MGTVIKGVQLNWSLEEADCARFVPILEGKAVLTDGIWFSALVKSSQLGFNMHIQSKLL